MQAYRYLDSEHPSAPYRGALAAPSHAHSHNTRTGKLQSRFIGAFRTTIGSALLAAALLAQPAHASVAPALATSQVLPSTGAPTSGHYFAPTGKSVQGDFLAVYNRYGLQFIGYPLSDERRENGLTVQYFERVRMERHPELAAKGYGVLMTRLGDSLSKPAQPFAGGKPSKGALFFNQTNHSLSEPFLSYWKKNGSVELFGYPISEPRTENGLRVQWFERARFEYHPELAAKGQAIQLSLLGSAAYNKVALPSARPAASTKPASKPSQAKQAPAQPAQVSLSGMESYLLKSINEQRAAAGLGPVQVNSALTDLARSRSNDMAARNYFSHNTPEGSTFLDMLNRRAFPYKYAGEILSRNNYPDDQAASTAMTSYLNSPPHKAIIMDGRYNLVGIGYAKSGEDEMHYFTVIFAQQ